MRIARHLVLWFLLSLSCSFAEPELSHFKRVVLSEDFFSEGACFADIDGDGIQDIISGPYWYAGPDFRSRHAYASVERFPIAVYSRHFLSFAYDFNGDGRQDILAIPMPGDPAHWFENPGTTGTLWEKHLAFEWVGNESPTLTDLTGDGKPELIFCYDKRLGYAEPNWDAPGEPWTFTAITGDRGFGRFTHGLGVGDVNGDGRLDVLETNGWWEQPPEKGKLFTLHPVPFAEAGGAQMFTDDVDGDGDQDVISVQNAHGYGLSWFEQFDDGSGIQFRRHDILTEKPEDNPYGVSISQMHAAALADIDGDGIKDIVTGKRFWAHGGGDPGSQELPLLYWFRNVRDEDGVHFQPWLIDERSGVGTQLTVGDVTGNGLNDIVIGNKLGTFVMLQEKQQVEESVYRARRPQKTSDPAHIAGTALFNEQVRSSEALSPDEERASFVLPEGFEIQLVAAEPDIAKPMNLAFDARGRLWVSSSLEYPYAAPDDRKGRDTIKILEDTTGDGRADKITTFADDLNIPMGLYPYQDGVICFSIPNIWFLRDTDGDDRADVRERLYGPFDCTRDTHGMCNAFTRGHDGWLYACHGFNNQSTVSGQDGHAITMQSGNTFRIRLDGSRIELVGHGQVNPFGMTFDSHGDLFTADCHTKPINLVLPGGYHDSFGKPHDGLGYVPNIMEHLHRSTGIAGIALGETTHFPQVYQDSTFGGNVVTSRINRNRLVKRGSSVVAEETPDFLISGDPWFRPVDLQVGPDGALYVADFYNCIIGHYEVPLTHPRRDRHRGRIWRIVHKPNGNRRDAPGKPATKMPDLRSATVDDLIAWLNDSNPVRAGLILDELSGRDDSALGDKVRAALDDASLNARIHLHWVLSRTGALTMEEIREAAGPDQPVTLRVHAYHFLRARESLDPEGVQLLRQGLQDPEPLVRRAAAMASTRHPDATLIPDLLHAHRTTSKDDVHGLHALKIALKAHLTEPENFSRLEDASEAIDIPVLADACLAVKHETAGKFVVDHLDELQSANPEAMARYLRFAARSASLTTVGKVVRTAKSQDSALQLELLQAIREGLQQRGVDPAQSSPESQALRSWAADLARNYLGPADAAGQTLAWTAWPSQSDNPWRATTRRSSSDNQQESLLWSSFPMGEERTGSYRSEPFEIGPAFHFYLAGHDGHPNNAPQGRNWVRLRDAGSDKVLHETNPPGNDVAQHITWDTSAHAGRRVYVELTDGDDRAAFAWLAAGRFSVEGLNPSTRSKEQPAGARLVQEFRLTEFKPLLRQLLTRQKALSPATAAMAQALAALQNPPEPHLTVLALALELPSRDQELKRRTIAAIVSPPDKPRQTIDLLEAWMNSLPRNGQIRLAERLAQTPESATSLLTLVQSGHASARLLQTPTVKQTLQQTLSESEQTVLTSLLEGLPDEDEALETTIAQRIRHYRDQGGDVQAGKILFDQHCAVCHQIGGEGTVLGPNLDGIGNRGLARLTEDVLAPNRNVDVAFRLTTITTYSGETHMGLVKGTEGAQLLLADPAGETFTIPTENVKEQTALNLSLMPAIFAEALSEEGFRNLQAYLLSLTN